MYMTKYTQVYMTQSQQVTSVHDMVTGVHDREHTGVHEYSHRCIWHNVTQQDTATLLRGALLFTYSIQNLFNSLKLFSHGEGQSHLGS